MSEITISTEKKETESKDNVNDVKDVLKAADEYAKLKEQNDKLEAEYIRQQEIKAKIAIGGRAQAGQFVPEKTEKEKADDEAKEILRQIR